MKVESLANKAYKDIRKKILSNQIVAYTRLKEDEFAKKIGASRMAVREALIRLLGEDLVYLGEKGGYHVKPLIPTEVHEIREIREIIELGAIRLAFKKLSEDKLEKLEKICDDFSTMVSKGYYNGALEADMKFHETIIESAENQKLLDIYHTSHLPLFHQKLAQSHTEVHDYDQTDVEHREVVKALRNGNLALAEETMIRHFARGAAVVLEP